MTLALFADDTKSINQPWKQTPKHLRKAVWKPAMLAMQKLFHIFHELQLMGWLNYGSHFAGRHPEALIERVLHWNNQFPNLLSHDLACMLPTEFVDGE
jgi:hypothetical protein